MGQVVEHIMKMEELLQTSDNSSWQDRAKKFWMVTSVDGVQLLNLQRSVKSRAQYFVDKMQVYLSLVSTIPILYEAS